ncbi:MAG: hypothetical protein RLT05_17930 [Bauldia litoralis]
MSGGARRNPAGIFTGTTAALAVLLGAIALVLLYAPIAGLALLSFSARPLSGIPWPMTLEWYFALFEGENARWVGPLITSVIGQGMPDSGRALKERSARPAIGA